ncbi:MAG TPA: SDR family oxidoreductase [Pedobacter sp.]|jgi:NAD(P)H dehydrogenase (quinone)
MKIAVTGATGQLGQIVIEKLKEKIDPRNIFALVRVPQKAADFKVEIREADYDKPHLLETALEGIDTLILISGSEIGKRAQQHLNIVAAAKKSGVKRIVYTSLLHADDTSLGIADEHVITEGLIKSSGIDYTILRNGWYTENYAASVRSGIESGSFYGSANDGKISAAPRQDYAEAIVAVATSEGHQGQTYELAGDEAFTLTELAEELSRQINKPVSYINLHPEEYIKSLITLGVPEGVAQMLTGIDASISKGDLFDDSHQLSKLIGRPTRPLKSNILLL